VPADSVRDRLVGQPPPGLGSIGLPARTTLAVAIVSASLACLPDTSWAQGKTSIPESVRCGTEVRVADRACQREFDDWQAREKKWRDNRRVWANYVDYQGFRVPRVTRPAPPAWIEPYCETELALDAIVHLSPVCQAYHDYLRYDWTQHIEGPQTAITFSQRVPQAQTADSSAFVDYLLKHLHYDGLWTNSQNGPRVYGLFGTHLTLAHASRLYLWGPPGVLVLRRPEGTVQLRMTWGIDLLVGDIPIPFGPGYRLPLFFSIAKVFDKHEEEAIQRGVNAGMDMIGFSITIRR
jgi:hypothetical protein